MKTDEAMRMMSAYLKEKKNLEAMPDRMLVSKYIDDRERLFWQWNEEGAILEGPIADEDADAAIEQAQKRKKASMRVKAMAKRLDVSLPLEFSPKAVAGAELESLLKDVEGMERRDCFAELDAFVKNAPKGRVIALFGLRRTGKTTLMLQSIAALPEDVRRHCAYIVAGRADTVDSLEFAMAELRRSSDITHFFIDEATAVQSFASDSGLLADVEAMHGMTIVLAGTDSLKIKMSLRAGLLGRAHAIHTTGIMFSEWHRLTGGNIANYMRHGGIFFNQKENTQKIPFRDSQATNNYVLSVACSNIQHSLDDWQDGLDYGALHSLRERDELTNAIQRVVADESHRFFVDAICREYKIEAYGEAMHCLEKKDDAWIDLRQILNDEEILLNYMEELGIQRYAPKNRPADASRGLLARLADDEVHEMLRYLKDLDLFMTARHLSPGRRPLFADRHVLAQPGLRWAHYEAFVRALHASQSFYLLPEKQQQDLKTKFQEIIEGRLLEEIVMRDLMLALDAGRGRSISVMSARDDATGREYDVVVADESSQTCIMLEVKNSSEKVDNQAKWLRHEEFKNMISRIAGTPVARCVVYNGSNCNSDDVLWRNATEFLSKLKLGMSFADVVDILLHAEPAPEEECGASMPCP